MFVPTGKERVWLRWNLESFCEDIIRFEQKLSINLWCVMQGCGAMTSLWPCDITMTLHWLHCDIMLTFFWPCCVNSVATPILPCNPIRKSIYHRLGAESRVSGVIRPTLIRVPASSPRIRPTCFWVRFSSSCDLYTWLAAFLALWSNFDESHDHAFAQGYDGGI